MSAVGLAERRVLPDWLVRVGIRKLLRERLNAMQQFDHAQEAKQFATHLRNEPIAVHTKAANKQHYEVPPRFFQLALGPRLKYSCCHFETPTSTISTAEASMLRLTCQRAELADGQDVLDLGCGWGSFSLWAAEQYPKSKIVGVSNSNAQREYVLARAEQRGLNNLEIITSDVQILALKQKFDRVVSIEMFEHMRNYEKLLRKISGWLTPDGKLFVHIFCHQNCPYVFTVNGKNDWLARHFFTGGIMPSYDLLAEFQDDLQLSRHWKIDGDHYARTSEAWLDKLDQNTEEIRQIFEEQDPRQEAALRFQRWRMFFMACAELFRYNSGREWFVGHYLFEKGWT